MKTINNYITEKLKISKDTKVNSNSHAILSKDEFFDYIKLLCKQNKFRSIMDEQDPVISVNEDTYPYMLLKYHDNRFFSTVENDYVGVYTIITIVNGRNNNYIRIPYKGKKLDIAPGGQLRANKYNINRIFEIFINRIKEK